MIKYNKLEIDNDSLIIDFEVEDKPYYSGISIEGVRVDTPETYGTDTPYILENEDDVTHYTNELSISGFSKELLIITPQVYVALPPDTPCGADIIEKAVVYNKRALLQKGLVYLKELGESCAIPKGFIDFILRLKALDMSIQTCNYTEAIKYWKMLHRAPIKTTTNNCGCYGLD